MILNLTQVTSGKLSKMPFSHRFIPEIEEKTNFGIITVNVFDIEGEIVKNGSEMKIEYSYSGSILYSCSRCLDEVLVKYQRHIKKMIVRSIPESSEEEDDWYLAEDHLLNLEAIVSDEVMIDLPYQTLCDNECKGLCPNCGVNLNHETCSCSEEKIDPRLEILKNFFTQE